MNKQEASKLPFYTGLFYFFIRPIARIGIWIYYRKIFMAHLDRIPKDKPVILAANHPTGFMEPCVMAVFMKRPLFFLVRGDFFRKPIFNFLMRSLNMIPIFRARDGNFRDLKSNYESFEACYQALQQNKTIMIFPEGNAVHEKRLRSIKKGISRMAYGAFQQHPDLEDLYIVPVGISYTYAERPRSEMMISCGEAISVRQLLEETGDHFATFDRKLRKEVTSKMKENLVHIDEAEDEFLVEQLQQIHRGKVNYQSIFPVLSSDNSLLEADQLITQQVKYWDEPKKMELKQMSQAFFQDLEQSKIPVEVIAQPIRFPFWKKLLFGLSTLPVWIAYAFVYIPSRIAKNIADNKVKRTEFYSPVMLAGHLGTFLIFYIFWFLVSIISGQWWLLLLAVIIGPLAYGSLVWREQLQRYIWQQRFQALPGEKKQALKSSFQSVLEAIQQK
ncbi:MAG: 1-acyl-sn-glycerol-3-phosphate acyltransferase [Bacteroidota bacterium]